MSTITLPTFSPAIAGQEATHFWHARRGIIAPLGEYASLASGDCVLPLVASKRTIHANTETRGGVMTVRDHTGELVEYGFETFDEALRVATITSANHDGTVMSVERVG